MAGIDCLTSRALFCSIATTSRAVLSANHSAIHESRLEFSGRSKVLGGSSEQRTLMSEVAKLKFEEENDKERSSLNCSGLTLEMADDTKWGLSLVLCTFLNFQSRHSIWHPRGATMTSSVSVFTIFTRIQTRKRLWISKEIFDYYIVI